jgi:hypothetical protein
MTVTGFELSDLFDRARAAPESAQTGSRTTLSEDLAGLDRRRPDELDRSLRLKLALDGMKAEGGFDAFAIRCWPETFTEYGGAVCGPASMMGEAGCRAPARPTFMARRRSSCCRRQATSRCSWSTWSIST